MPQLATLPFNSCLALSTLFSISSAIALPNSPLQHLYRHKIRMNMPDSPPSSDAFSSTSYWNFATSGLPVSYRVALVIDAFVIIVTFASLCLLGWYMRRQYRRRKSQRATYLQERDGLVEEGGKLHKIDSRIGITELGEETQEKKGKKGHVRWGSEVRGGSFDVPLQTPENMVVKGRLIVSEEEEVRREPVLSGYRINLLGGKAKSSPIAKEFRGDPMARGGWESEQEGQRRVGRSGGDGYRAV